MAIWKALVLILTLNKASLSWAHDYEVLFPYSLGRDALEFSAGFDTKLDSRVFLVDGNVESLGTHAVTFDRTLIAHIRSITNVQVADRLFARLGMSAVANRRKVEGQELPRTVKDESFYDFKPRVELTFYTQTNLEVFTGINYRVTSGFRSVTKSIDLETTEVYGSASMDYPHFGFVKRAAAFQGGFLFQQGAEKARSVKKSNNIDQTTLTLEDHIHDPTTISIFAKFKRGTLDLYGEFSAIHAGDGGNKSEDGTTVEEDYIKLSFGLDIPLGFIDLDNRLIYKTLSYADNRNVSFKTMPQFGYHVNGSFKLGSLEISGGLVLGYGKDSQSISEFNANYQLIAFGGSASILMSF